MAGVVMTTMGQTWASDESEVGKSGALSVVWTTPLVATLGMSLTIPLAMVADMILHGRHYSAVYILGSVQVFSGFVIANLADRFSRSLGL
nr:unnamed protein product [Digitaria exilis]